MLTCRRCGWRAGWPVVRWVTDSLPVNQLRRTVVGPSLVIVVIAGALVLSGASAQVAVSDLSTDDILDSDGEEVVPGITDGVGTLLPADNNGETEEDSTESLNTTKVEVEFKEIFNTERRDRGLNELSLRPALTELATGHAQDMAEHDYIGHEDSAGKTHTDRFEEAGLLPECNLDTAGNRYYPGAENAAGALINEPLMQSWDEEVITITTERELAQYLFDAWMNSPPHKEVMVLESAEEIGLGLATSGNDVYATLKFC